MLFFLVFGFALVCNSAAAPQVTRLLTLNSSAVTDGILWRCAFYVLAFVWWPPHSCQVMHPGFWSKIFCRRASDFFVFRWQTYWRKQNKAVDSFTLNAVTKQKRHCVRACTVCVRFHAICMIQSRIMHFELSGPLLLDWFIPTIYHCPLNHRSSS